MSYLPDHIITLLQGAGLGTPEVDLFHSKVPDSPDQVIVVLPRPGFGLDESHDGGVRERPRVQILSRARKWADAYSRAYSAFKTLRKRNLSIGGTWYLSIVPIGSLEDLQVDGRGRRTISFNVQVEKELDP